MNRREFVALAGLAAASSAWPRTGTGDSATDEWRTAFARALQDDAGLLGWRGIGDAELHTAELELEGTWPDALRGVLYRNGPAGHEVGGKRYHHWFDGDGMVQSFRIGAGRIDHRGRFVATDKRRAELAAGTRLRPAFGTPLPERKHISSPDSLNPANISVVYHAGELLALWEGGSAHRIDPISLETDGKNSWRADLAGVPFTAHPKLEPDGALWGFGYILRRGQLVIYHVGPDGALRSVGTVPVDRLGMVHDFAVTERHLVFVLSPYVFDRGRFSPETSFLDAHVWRPELGTRVLVVAKNDLGRRRWWQLPPGFSFHFGNAWEEGDGRVRFDYCVAPDPTIMTETFRYVMRGERRSPTGPTRYAQVQLGPGSDQVEERIEPLLAEFPKVSPRVVGARHRYVYAIGGDYSMRGGLAALLRRDVETGEVQQFEFGPDTVPEEHVFVPRPDGGKEDDGWLLGTVLDTEERITRLNVFVAADLASGPVAVAKLPYPLPLGFHGQFVSEA